MHVKTTSHFIIFLLIHYSLCLPLKKKTKIHINLISPLTARRTPKGELSPEILFLTSSEYKILLHFRILVIKSTPTQPHPQRRAPPQNNNVLYLLTYYRIYIVFCMSLVSCLCVEII